MKSMYLENLERVAGLLMILGIMVPAAIAGRMTAPEQSLLLISVCSIPFWVGALLMWRIKAAQRAADRLLGKVEPPEGNGSIKCN